MNRWVTRIGVGFVATGVLLALNDTLDEDRTFQTGPTEEVLNPSTDGRYHTCGYVTEDGVTEHLDAYHQRCRFTFGPEYVCKYDDLLALELKVDAYGHKAGEVLCMSIDEYNDHPGRNHP